MILELIERLALAAEKEGLGFLVIGGHAVTHHGYARMTLDVDFLARGSQRKEWFSLLRGLGYEPFAETAAFVQFSSSTPGRPQIHLMFVLNDTWEKLKAEAEARPQGGMQIRIPHVRHLVALKLHAAKNPARISPEKDWNDIEELLRRHRLNPTEPGFEALILRYGGEDSLARLRTVWQVFIRDEPQ